MKVTHSSPISNKVIHQGLCQLAVPEWYDRQSFLDISCIHSTVFADTFLRKTHGELPLVGAHHFHTLPKDHERLIDVTRLSKAITCGVGVLGAL